MEQKYRSAHNNIVAHALYSFACYSVKSESIFFGEWKYIFFVKPWVCTFKPKYILSHPSEMVAQAL